MGAIVNGIEIPLAGTDHGFDPNGQQLWAADPQRVVEALERSDYVCDEDEGRWSDPTIDPEQVAVSVWQSRPDDELLTMRPSDFYEAVGLGDEQKAEEAWAFFEQAQRRLREDQQD